MKLFLLLLTVILLVQLSVAPPVSQNKKDDKHTKDNEIDDSKDMDGIMEYRRYLTEVVQVLESDPVFRAKLGKANDADIRTGKIADQLEFVNHKVRTKLDELKRDELERLRRLATRENELMNNLDVDHLKMAEHLDHTNTRTFEIQDLRKLIAKTTKDLAEADRRRREEFKQYEMEKKYEEQEKLKEMNDSERKKYEEELQTLKEKHKKHEPVHHPGSKQQLEEVWEKQDHMETDEFNPKTFFYLHDLDGNGVWDQNEVKALFLKELDKLYSEGASQDDLLKRAEEMERMREHVFNEADLNKDGLISYDELLEQTITPEFQQDEGWKALDEQEIYTPEEFETFKKHKQEEIQRMIAKGMPPPHPGSVHEQHAPYVPVAPGVDPPHHEQFQGQYPPQQGGIPQQQQQYPNHVPVDQVYDQMSAQQQYQQMSQHQPPQVQLPNQQYHPGQQPVQQQVQHPGQIPIQQQVHPGQIPVQQQVHPGQIPVQQQVHPGQVPVQQQIHPGQVPVQQQIHPGQIPVQQQVHPGQVPVHPGQIPIPQQLHTGQVPVQQQPQQAHPGQVQGTVQQHNTHGQDFRQQNTAAQNAHGNVVAQQHNAQDQAQQGSNQQNAQPAQPAV